jgi:predicted DNA-binding transcriptional regulator AlpA
VTARPELRVEPAIFSPRAAAAYIGITVRTLLRWREDPSVGFPPAIELSTQRIGWRREDLDAWIASRPRRRAS